MNLLRKILRITPLKLSLVIVTFFVGISFKYDLEPTQMRTMDAFNLTSLDIKFLLRGPEPAKNKIIIVAGDEKGFQKFGQWPWDRATVFAPLLKKLCSYNIQSVGMDIVWSEQEKNLTGKLAQALESKIGTQTLNQLALENSGDKALNQALKNCRNKVVLGYAPVQEVSEGLTEESYKKRLKILTSQGHNTFTTITKGAIRYLDEDNPNLTFEFLAQSGLLNHPSITPNNTPQGFFTNIADSDGTYRHALMFAKMDDYFTPTLTLRMAQLALTEKDTPLTLSIQPNAPDAGQTEALNLELKTAQGAYAIPMDLKGQTLVNYRGPNHTFPNVSIVDVLSDSEDIEFTQINERGEIYTYTTSKKEFFDGAFVLTGITAIALYDIRPRPFDEGASGVENHANILDNILSNDFLVRPSPQILLILYIVTFLVSIFYGVLITKLNAKWGAVTAFISITGLLFFDQVYLFNNGLVFSGHLTALQLLFQFIGITVLKYMQEETDKKFIKSAFDKFVSPEVVNSMLKDPKKLRIGGEKKNLSILFSDIRGFTTLSEKLDVTQLSSLLNNYLGEMTEILQKNAGTLDKYIGDAVMGFWGAPLEQLDHASKAVKTTVEMIERLEVINEGYKEKYGIDLKIGIGINTGDVSVGNFGSKRVFSYTVIGDHVNLASRLEGLTKFYGASIIVSESTYEQINKDTFLARELDTVKVKGKQKPVRIYEIIPNTERGRLLKSALEFYNEGLQSYYHQQWEIAMTKFHKFLEIVKKDKISEEMLTRCRHFKDNPPEAQWDGSWKMTAK